MGQARLLVRVEINIDAVVITHRIHKYQGQEAYQYRRCHFYFYATMVRRIPYDGPRVGTPMSFSRLDFGEYILLIIRL